MFRWQAENGVCWYFVYIDKDTSTKIQNTLRKTKIPRIAFGSVRVEVSIGSSVWKTSLFPSSKEGIFMLPVKALVRRQESVEEGDLLDITLSLL